MRAPRRARGVALLAALIMVALAAIAATAIAFNAGIFARRSIGVYDQAQALYIAQGAEALAMYALRQDAAGSNPQSLVDSPDEAWATPYGPVQLADGVILEAGLEDLQGRFNINNLITNNGLADPVAGKEFEQLLSLLGLDTRWRGLITDWIDADDQPSVPDGAEDSTYLGINPGYRTPNLPISSISELLALPGMTRKIYERLAPYIAALPPGTPVNLCTASGEVLDAMLGQQAYSSDAGQLTEQRKNGCFPTLPVFTNALDAQQRALISGRIGENSEYFRLRSWITIGTTRFTLYSLIHRRGAGSQGNMQVRTVLRTFGTE